MEKSKNNINYAEDSNDQLLDSSEKIAKWMRDKDFAFDFRNDKWSRTGGIEVERSSGYVVCK